MVHRDEGPSRSDGVYLFGLKQDSYPTFFNENVNEEERRRKMIPKIKKILYATDLSKNSSYAFL
jgi:hypothetical protein